MLGEKMKKQKMRLIKFIREFLLNVVRYTIYKKIKIVFLILLVLPRVRRVPINWGKTEFE